MVAPPDTALEDVQSQVPSFLRVVDDSRRHARSIQARPADGRGSWAVDHAHSAHGRNLPALLRIPGVSEDDDPPSPPLQRDRRRSVVPANSCERAATARRSLREVESERARPSQSMREPSRRQEMRTDASSCPEDRDPFGGSRRMIVHSCRRASPLDRRASRHAPSPGAPRCEASMALAGLSRRTPPMGTTVAPPPSPNAAPARKMPAEPKMLPRVPPSRTENTRERTVASQGRRSGNPASTSAPAEDLPLPRTDNGEVRLETAPDSSRRGSSDRESRSPTWTRSRFPLQERR